MGQEISIQLILSQQSINFKMSGLCAALTKLPGHCNQEGFLAFPFHIRSPVSWQLFWLLQKQYGRRGGSSTQHGIQGARSHFHSSANRGFLAWVSVSQLEVRSMFLQSILPRCCRVRRGSSGTGGLCWGEGYSCWCHIAWTFPEKFLVSQSRTPGTLCQWQFLALQCYWSWGEQVQSREKMRYDPVGCVRGISLGKDIPALYVFLRTTVKGFFFSQRFVSRKSLMLWVREQDPVCFMVSNKWHVFFIIFLLLCSHVKIANDSVATIGPSWWLVF